MHMPMEKKKKKKKMKKGKKKEKKEKLGCATNLRGILLNH